MATNEWFNQYNHEGEQGLLDDLIVESLRIHALDMKYLPRTGVNKDDTLNEYEYNTFDTAIDCEFYIKSATSFEGQGSFLEKFGMQIKDQMILTMAKRSFNSFIKPITTKERPLEGDLIYIPMIEACYEINFVETSLPFYQLGALQTYDITLELYESSHDVFSTGIAAIDDKYNGYGDANSDPYDQGSEFALTSNTILDFTEINPFTDGF